jgi:hypothetical protein
MKQQYEAWAASFLKAPTAPMSPSLTEAFFSLTMGEMQNLPLPPKLEESFEYQLVSRRSEFVGLKLSKHAIALIACISGSPGDSVMYVHALRYFQHKHGAKEVTVSEMANAFPMGFLAEQTLSELWDAQKGYNIGLPCDNMLDKIGDIYKETENDRAVA